MIRHLATAFALVALLAGVAGADIIKHLEFGSDGVMPSSDPELHYYYSALTEAEAIDVSGGTMMSTLLPTGGQQAFYSWPDMYYARGIPSAGGIDAAQPWVMEARVRVPVHAGSHPNHIVGGLTVWTGNKRYRIFHTATGVRANKYGAITYVDYPCDISQWHVIRMESNGGGPFSAYVDGVMFVDNQGGITDGGNGFRIELSPHSGGGQVEWDWIRFEAGPLAVSNEDLRFGQVKALFR